MKIKLLLVVFLILFLGLIVRLFYWQVIEADNLSSQAQGQYNSSQVTQAPRGNIIASDGSFWALRTTAWLVYADTRQFNSAPSVIASKIAPILDLDESDLVSVLSKDAAWIPIAQKVDTDIKNNLDALKISGINFQQVEDRYYPEASVAAQILGFVGKDTNGDDTGYFGLEGYYNLPLSGKPGFVGREIDPRGAPILLGGSKQVSAVSGVDLETSIDKRVQILAENKLKDGIEKYGATGGSVTVMDPYTGEILAMVGYPSFDPAEYGKYSNEVFKNPVISNTFEPGSIFKPIIMASALDAGVVTPETKCDICDKPLAVDGYLIKTWNNQYQPDISMTNVIVDSDNVGMSFVGEKMGQDRMYDYLTRFGIGEKTGVDLQGEVAVSMRKKGTWSNVDLYTTTFGQGIAVTGIEMVRAVAAIANGGNLVTPRAVEAIKGDGWEEKLKTDQPKRIISEKASQEASQMMLEAADRGEAKWTKIPGFDVAGKTGTAQIPVAGHYDPNRTNHSFIGFAPVGKPKFVMLVTLDSPTSSPWAAETAAPLWFSIAKNLFPYLGVTPK